MSARFEPADNCLRMLAGGIDALIAFLALPIGPALLWVAADPATRYWQGARIEWRPELLVICYALYSLLCHAAWRKTLGKAFCGLSVVHMDGSSPARSTLIGREMIRGFLLGLVSYPLALSISLWIEGVAREWAGKSGSDPYVEWVLWVYMLTVAPIVSAVILCPILVRKRGFHDFAADTQVVQKAPSAAQTEGVEGQPNQRDYQAALFFAGVPILLLAAFYSPNGYVFLGILLASMLVYRFVLHVLERRRAKSAAGPPPPARADD